MMTTTYAVKIAEHVYLKLMNLASEHEVTASECIEYALSKLQVKHVPAKSLEEMVKDWTAKAQNSSNTDDERAIFYQCAEELHTFMNGHL